MEHLVLSLLNVLLQMSCAVPGGQWRAGVHQHGAESGLCAPLAEKAASATRLIRIARPPNLATIVTIPAPTAPMQPGSHTASSLGAWTQYSAVRQAQQVQQG
ncbi:hypothetical protein HaLaN_24337 [Haematococcus lacustris]|uniref:Secreted protein n=1 Tax=Haematococcus lacustris TaxID=44745 RepID=A0A6A0A2C6_HAELA|nr:hypothetical protein HaLaN_24337 [Haematococcus lacustris]